MKMSCELLVPEIFNAAKLYFDVLLADGLPLSRVKELRLRPYVVRFQRMINGKRKSLYKWKPEFVETIRIAIQRPDPPKIEEAFHELEIPARTESQQKANAKVSSEVSITPPIDSSFLEGSSSLFSHLTMKELRKVKHSMLYVMVNVPFRTLNGE